MNNLSAAGDWLASLDPGRSKCGLALAERQRRQVVAAAVLAPEACLNQLQRWRQQGLQRVLLGNGTHSRPWQGQLQELGLSSELVDEHGTTLAARQRYWQLYPARSWRRLLPQGLRLPPRDIDDVVAQLLLERHWGQPLQPPGAQS
jgi:RNase H-fold protein (predicted Holliday junction resolvase)